MTTVRTRAAAISPQATSLFAKAFNPSPCGPILGFLYQSSGVDYGLRQLRFELLLVSDSANFSARSPQHYAGATQPWPSKKHPPLMGRPSRWIAPLPRNKP